MFNLSLNSDNLSVHGLDFILRQKIRVIPAKIDKNSRDWGSLAGISKINSPGLGKITNPGRIRDREPGRSLVNLKVGY